MPARRRADAAAAPYTLNRPHRSNAVDLTTDTPPARAPEVIDLSSDSEEDAAAPPAQEVIRQEANEEGDPRLAFLQCVICLDSPTDLTATRCGHLFCHQCISQALRASQVNARTAGTANGACPVCRKSLTVKSLLPLSILKRARPAATEATAAQATHPA
jgi:hypothetical protein